MSGKKELKQNNHLTKGNIERIGKEKLSCHKIQTRNPPEQDRGGGTGYHHAKKAQQKKVH